MNESPQRRLAAIVAADVANYSRLVGLDEERTVADLRLHRRELIDPALARYRGRIANTAGDSLLIEFSSVVDAVRCAAEIQQGMAERTVDQQEDRRIAFRFGIHVGDVLAEGDDLMGDGVNIAARIEALCTPGGILLSDAAHSQVQDRLDHAFSDAGEHLVKNIARPIRVWKWGEGGVEGPTTAIDTRPSIAVLAFNNMSGDPEQTYFAEGIAEDIITDLSKVSGLFVIARNSSFAYRGQSPDIRRICRELGVRYVLEGSVRKAGQRVRINAQLIEGATGGHVWADRFDRDLADIFTVQDEVTGEIVAALRVALTAGEARERAGRRMIDAEAYDLYMRARAHLFRFTPGDAREAHGLLERSLEIEPGFGRAYALLSLLLSTENANRWNDPKPDQLETALRIVDKGIDVDPNESECHHAKALALAWLGRHDAARASAERALELNPNHAGGAVALGQIADFTGHHAEAVGHTDHALQLDPHYHIALQTRGRALFALGRLDEAIAAFEERIRRAPQTDNSRVFLAATYGLSGRSDDARRCWSELIAMHPGFSLERMWSAYTYRTNEVLKLVKDGLSRAGIGG